MNEQIDIIPLRLLRNIVPMKNLNILIDMVGALKKINLNQFSNTLHDLFSSFVKHLSRDSLLHKCPSNANCKVFGHAKNNIAIANERN